MILSAACMSIESSVRCSFFQCHEHCFSQHLSLTFHVNLLVHLQLTWSEEFLVTLGAPERLQALVVTLDMFFQVVLESWNHNEIHSCKLLLGHAWDKINMLPFLSCSAKAALHGQKLTKLPVALLTFKWFLSAVRGFHVVVKPILVPVFLVANGACKWPFPLMDQLLVPLHRFLLFETLTTNQTLEFLLARVNNFMHSGYCQICSSYSSSQ